MKRVLVTGARGFIGGPCLQILRDRGYEIHAITSKNVALAAGADDAMIPTPNVTWHQCNLLQCDEAVAICQKIKPSHLLHLAWDVEPGYKVSERNLLWIKASMELLRAFYASGGRRATFTGTCFEYDPRQGVLHEDDTPTGPHTVYGASKHTLHELIKVHASNTELSYAWARVFYLYGPNENPGRLVASVIKSLLTGQTAACSSGHQVLDFLHVQDVASALVTVLDSDLRGAVNIGSGDPLSVRELVLTIARLLGDPSKVNLGAITSPENEPPVIMANIDKLKKIAWQPQFDIESGLVHTCEWWRKSLQTN